MTYAIVQKELVEPEVEPLARAFRTLPDLTSIDAQTAAHDAFGILLRGLDHERAGALQAALSHEGIETEVVSETEFPPLPNARIIRQVQFSADHLAMFDPMQRQTNVPWNDILLIAAGHVHTRETRRVTGTLEESGYHGAGLTSDGVNASRTRDEKHEHLSIDLFLTDRTTRFTISAEEFNFGHLGPRLSKDAPINYLFLVQELEENAPHASLNQGAFLACQKPPELFSYPSKQAYQEEMVWILWRIGRLAADAHETGESR